METRIVDAKLGMREAQELIKNGKLVVFPTETVYGLGASAYNEDAVKQIFIAKGRPQDNPLIVHISSLDQVNDLAIDIPDIFWELANKFMPGPITMILKKSPKIPYIVTAGGDTVGIRMPSNPYARELISGSTPIAAPSANKSKHVSPTTAQHVFDDLNGSIPLILDGGSCKVGIESTVLDLTSEVPTILRPGAITPEMLSPYIDAVYHTKQDIKITKSPGMKYTHYAPKVPTVMAYDINSAVIEYDNQVSNGRKPVLVIRDIYRDVTKDRDIVSLGVTVEDYTRNIYGALRNAENNYDYIIVERLQNKSGIERSVMNRVEKACGGKCVKF